MKIFINKDIVNTIKRAFVTYKQLPSYEENKRDNRFSPRIKNSIYNKYLNYINVNQTSNNKKDSTKSKSTINRTLTKISGNKFLFAFSKIDTIVIYKKGA